MAISRNKQEIEKQKLQKRNEKAKRREIKKYTGSQSFEDMIAYVDENGCISSTPPDMRNRTKIAVEDIQIATQKRVDIVPEFFNGRVEHFNEDKGYGFIKDIASMDKYFFHINDAACVIKTGNRVTFKTALGRKGMCAVEIKPIE